jgi:hypothetical protein
LIGNTASTVEGYAMGRGKNSYSPPLVPSVAMGVENAILAHP